MAKRVCPFCKEKISIEAVICKGCRRELLPLPKPKWYLRWWGVTLIIIGTIYLVVVGILFITFEQGVHDVKNESKQKVQKAPEPSKLPNQLFSDNQLFNDFYQDFKNKAREFDTTAEPFFTALQNNDWVGATQIAKNTKTILGQQWLAIYNAKIPKFKDKKLEEAVKKAKDEMSTAYLYKHKVVKSFLELVKDPSTMIVRIAEMKEQSEKFQANLIVGAITLEAISLQLKSEDKSDDTF